MKDRTLNCLMSVARESYRLTQAQRMVAEIKADETLGEDLKTELLDFADKVIEAETKMIQEAMVAVEKHGKSANIVAAEEDEDNHGFY